MRFLTLSKKYPQNEHLIRKAFVDEIIAFQKTGNLIADNFDISRSEREKFKTPFQVAYDRYFELFAIYNKYVPGAFPQYRPIGYKRSAEVAKSGRKIMEKMEALEEALIPSTGYENMEAFRNALSAVPHGKEALDFFAQEKMDLVIRRPEGARFWLEKTGFQNQRVTGSSNGSYNPNRRENVESMLTRTPRTEYEKFDVETKPKYGTIAPKVSEGFKAQINDKTRHYGADLWVLKKEVSPYLSIVPTDSFYQPMIPTNKAQTFWDQMFIPWKYRELLAPYLLGSFKIDPALADSTPTMEFGEFKFNSATTPADFYYFEIQIFRDLSLNEVEALIFTKTPPDKATAKMLRSYGIKIFDQRTEERKEWKDDL